MNISNPLQLPGLFWAIDPPKSNEPRTPPAPVWLAPDYLPGLEEAQVARIPLMSNSDLQAALSNKRQMICDIEVYPNYFLAAFADMETGKIWYCEFDSNGFGSLMEPAALLWMLSNFEILTFNGKGYDMPLLALAIEGYSCGEIYHASCMIIQQEIKPWQVLKAYKVEPLEINHIDLMEVCPLRASLKIYGGRLHVPRMQDLPFNPHAELSPEQITILRHYCINDLTTTAFLAVNLEEQISIRREMSTKYGVDLRSKSDAQIAEAVIQAELFRLNGWDAKAPDIEPGTWYSYRVPPWVEFHTPAMQAALAAVRNARFVVSESGSVETPPELEGLVIAFGNGNYRMGIGGLHSSEEKVSHRACDKFKIVDRDVVSYYPQIILNQKLHPSHLGFDFLTVYQSLVTRRVNAKKSGDKVTADMLKICINGSFGKFGSKYSALYAPDLLIQVTITGQLALLMMIERLESNGVQILSANTDGIVMKYPRIMEDMVLRVVREWEKVTGFETEETEYAGIYCNNVNNYIAVKPGGKVKTKGTYNIPEGIFRFHKNPEHLISVDAVIAYLTEGKPIAETVRGCRDIRRFITVRAVKGGAVKDGVFLGKAIRFYWSTSAAGEIVYAASGNKVPKSDGARPCMELPREFPGDVDFARYEAESVEMLRDLGV
jgi:hypothetical protein